MKIILVLLLLCSGFVEISAQTVALEKATLTVQYQSGKLTNEEVQKKKKQLDALIAEGFFDQVPYDSSSKKIILHSVIDLPGMMKKQIITRIKEWCAIHYGNINAVMHYSDDENGKIIIKGWFPVQYKETYTGWFGLQNVITPEVKCWHTISFTVKDSKMKMVYEDLHYELTYGGYSVGGTYIPRTTAELYMDWVFPIIDNTPETYQGRINLIKDTFTQVTANRESLRKYILFARDDYGF